MPSFSTTYGLGDLRPNVLKRAFSKVSRLGTAIGLGGVPQFIKQTTPLRRVFYFKIKIGRNLMRPIRD